MEKEKQPRREWSSKEKEDFFKLIRKYKSINKAAKIYSAKTGRTHHAIIAIYEYWKKRGRVPKDCIDIIEDAKEKYKWPEKDKKLLLKTIQESPNNFREAYRKVAAITGKREDTVRVYFYNYRKKEGAKVLMLNIGGRKTCSPNRKNIYPGTGGTVHAVRLPWWKKLLKTIGLS